MRSAFKALKRAVLPRDNDNDVTFEVDSQWILERDFRALPESYQRTDSSNNSKKINNQRKNGHIGDKHTRKVTSQKEISSNSNDIYKVVKRTSAKTHVVKLDAQEQETFEMQERSANILGMLTDLQRQSLEPCKSCESPTHSDSQESPSATDSASRSLSDSSDDETDTDYGTSECESNAEGAGGACSSTESKSRDEHEDSGEVSSKASPNKNDNKPAASEICVKTHLDSIPELNSRESDRPTIGDDENFESLAILNELDEVLEESENREGTVNNKVIKIKIRSIREMWMQKEKEEEAKPFQVANKSQIPEKVEHRLAEKKLELKCEENSDREECDFSEDDVGLHAEAIRDELKTDQTRRPNSYHEHISDIPKPSGIVQRMAQKMQQIDEDIKRQEEMVANHVPLDKPPPDHDSKPVSKATTGDETDDSFLLYLLEIGRKDEANNSKNTKKSQSFFLGSKKDYTRHVTKEATDNNNTEDKERRNFVDLDCVTDAYFRQILKSKSVPDDVKVAIMNEFYSIFNNSKTPRGVKKSLLDHLILNFTQQT